MTPTTRILRSIETDPWFNLALEDFFFSTIAPHECLLLLYVNDPSLLMGKNQNPWIECSVPLLQTDNIPLCRRISGGGTVYHDTGNLNFSFLMDRKFYDSEHQFGIILDALSHLGIDAKISNRRDITVQSKKISGNAFCVRKDRALHHGTLLINADLSALNRYLLPVSKDIRTHAVPSHRSEVTNITEIDPSISQETVIDALCTAFNKAYKGDKMPCAIDRSSLSKTDLVAVEELYQKNCSWEWIYASTPRFDFSTSLNNVNTKTTFNFFIKNGKIDKLDIISDNLDPTTKDTLAIRLQGCYFTHNDICDRINKISTINNELQYICDFMRTIQIC